jgi:GT2 family glycosyltransferase
VGSPLFDLEWYRLVLGRKLRRRAAVKHYLDAGRARGLTPHPLFAPRYFADQLKTSRTKTAAEPGEDPFVVYVRERTYTVPVHPLLDLGRYLAENPDAVEHPDGPLGHYAETGAARGARVNAWYRPDPASEPRGLVDWVYADARAWAERRQAALPVWGRGRARSVADVDLAPVEDPRIGSTTVVLVAERDEEEVRRSAASVLAQTTTDWQLLVLCVEGGVDPASCDLPDDPRISIVPGPSATTWAARNRGLAEARGSHVAFMVAGDEWLPGRLSSVHRALLETGSSWAHDCARDERPDIARRHASRPATRDRLLAGMVIDLGTVVVSREVALSVGGFDESLASGQLLELLLRLSDREDGAFAERLGVTLDQAARRHTRRSPHPQRPWVQPENLASANDPVLNEHLIDWEALAAREVDDGLVSVLIPTNGDWQLTREAVRCVAAAREPGLRTEIVVIDNGCGPVTSAVLAALPHEYDGVRVVRSPVNRGFGLGNNLGVAEARGATVVFLNNDTEVQPGWLAPLVDALRDETVLGAQSLLLYPMGSVQSAGVVFPRGGGIPHMLLNGFAELDTVGLEQDEFHALTGAALAVRFSDVVALHGFDPIFRNGMEDVDLCLRLARTRPGRFVVRPDSRVIHHESRAPGRFASSIVNRRLLLDRWAGQLPEDDVQAWARRGYEVIGHENRHVVDPDRRLCLAEPVLTRLPTPRVQGARPCLRWALKIASPYGPKGEHWGDTHFARHLADALRDLGQEVVIDHAGDFHRASAHLDDVVLLLRGLTPCTPVVDRVNLMWLISHPDRVGAADYVGWDRVYAASRPYAEKLAATGVPAAPLLQATDPGVFHPALAEPDSGHDVLFVGNSRNEKRWMVMAAVEQKLPLRVFGNGWEQFIPEDFISGHYLPNAEVGAAYRAARLVLNDHWDDMSEHGFLSNRLFDAVAAGARVVTDGAAGVEAVFGDAVRVVHDAEELADLANAADLDAVFGSDEVRRAHAARIAAEHSFAARAEVLLEDALRIRAARGLH